MYQTKRSCRTGKREPETVVKSCAVNYYTFGGRLVLWLYSRRGLQKYTLLSRFLGLTLIVDRPLFLRTDLPRVEGPSLDELVDAFFEDEHLDDQSKAEEDVSLRKSLGHLGHRLWRIWGRARVTLGGLGQQLIWTPDAGARPRGSTGFKKGYRIGDLFGFPTLIFWGHARNHSTINKGQEVWELRVAAFHLGAG
ncbi:hypothetical protein Cgig2_015311 [Carnegiea gigantea]|uniref:Uncharacterized protein n=1 Tax=Carnegiea gigantea TaxID=171969 RepID=A0A9Q1JR33_9CARY|nr:hypothetical protein Cgig2_015311 [Carnegiea gigantea]